MVTDFYQALTAIKSVTLRATEPACLYNEVCRIAVESGHALMAWVGLLSNGMIVPVACSDLARDYTAGLHLSAHEPADEGHILGPAAHAISTGIPCVCKDFASDGRSSPWRDRARRFGVGASLAFPFRRDGKTVGALNLYFQSPDACDSDLIELIDLMVTDLGHALDHIDQEAARDAAQQAAVERESRLATIIDAALEGIIIVDASMRVVAFNQVAAKMFGVKADEAMGHTLDRFIPQQYREAHKEHLISFASTGKTSRQMGGVRCVEALRSDGSIFPIEASISCVGHGQDALMTVMIRDVTLVREAEQAQIDRAAAQAANRAKTEFLSLMSHELRTPLNAILGFAQLMKVDNGITSAQKRHERIDHILKAGQHLCALIDEALDVASIELGHMRVQRSRVELEPLVEDVMGMAVPQAMDAGVLLYSSLKLPQGTQLYVDADRLKQVLMNLVSNAIKYNKRDGHVRVEAHLVDEEVEVCVRDNGMGMTAEQLQGLFDPFNRLGREYSGIEGTGLGLVLVKKLLEIMNGSLHISSIEGDGTAACVRLPLSRPCDGSVPAHR